MTAPGPAGDAVMVYLTDEAGRVLLVRARGLFAQIWMPPGGHIDTHIEEPPAVAACRELWEELALCCQPDDLVLLGTCEKDVGTGTLTLFAASCFDGTLSLGPEIAEARWVELDGCHELPTLPATDEGLRLLAALRQPDH